MKIVDVSERTVAISRYDDPDLPSGGLTTSVVAVTTSVTRNGKPIVGYGFSSVGRYGQGGLIKERFAPRLLQAQTAELTSDRAEFDPLQAWAVMMRGEKKGGHGERCVAVGTLDMALWDAAAKLMGAPLFGFLASFFGASSRETIPVYASGGYLYPANDLSRLVDEIDDLRGRGHTRFKIKIGAAPLSTDLGRLHAVRSRLGATDLLAADAMNLYARKEALSVADTLRELGLWWFEDVCDPLDFELHSEVSLRYGRALAAGEALFSEAEARLLHLHGGLECGRDFLVFDPVHCYGLPGYLKIISRLEGAGWPRHAFWPHGGHLFAHHVVAALGLGGAECNPASFHPFSNLPDESNVKDGHVHLSSRAGIGFEGVPDLMSVFLELN